MKEDGINLWAPDVAGDPRLHLPRHRAATLPASPPSAPPTPSAPTASMPASTHSSAPDDDTDNRNDAPHVEALFLIQFDKKVGYTIAWKRTASATDLDGVEFKSLPSGLHALASDLVYFTHAGFAGLSAFARGDASEADRNASFVAVGVLVRREGRFGRLGRGWLLAGRLEALAKALARDEGVAPLEEFWAEQTRGGKTRRATTEQATVTATAEDEDQDEDDERLPAYHPALAMAEYLELFGPLVFRLQQAALLRKRILFVGSPPVRTTCEFVYNLSVLSTISPRDAQHLAPGTEALLRLPALFSIGVHDIPYLEDLRNPKRPHTPGPEPAEGWVACTTDEIIATKQNLYDIVVEIPHASEGTPQHRHWPKLRTSAGDPIKASQRDVARYRLLHRQLWKHRQRAADTFHDDTSSQPDTHPLLSPAHPDPDTKRADSALASTLDSAPIEPTTWSRLAYSGFLWWASAGEPAALNSAEPDFDRDILGDTSTYTNSFEAGVVAYFHRLAGELIGSLADIIERDESGQSGDQDDDEEGVVWVDSSEMVNMGLDVWSEADRAFLSEFAALYFGRGVEVRGREVVCCGVRVWGV